MIFLKVMAPKKKMVPVENGVYLLRGQRVMVDSDLAEIYQVSTKQLNQQLRRNRDRFPEDFAFQLTAGEFAGLRSQSVTSKKRGGRRYLPWVFTEHGALMLASVLNSEVAIQASVRVVRAFVRLRDMVSGSAPLASKLAEMERRLDVHDTALVELFAALKRMLEPETKPKHEIGFHVRERRARYRTKKRF